MSMHNTENFRGGSLSKIIVHTDRVSKIYSGELSRGSEKLKEEYRWFKEFPTSLTLKYPMIVPKVIDFIERDFPGGSHAELHLERLHRISMSKSILQGLITPERVLRYLDKSLSFLCKKLYPVRTEAMSAEELYDRYHRDRIAMALEYLRRIPELSSIINAEKIMVNRIECPSVSEFIRWLDDTYSQIFINCRVVAMHGNFHPDNLLIKPEYFASYNNITFIDPRGDLLGPAHYDFAKLLLTLEAYYDEINYGLFNVRLKEDGNTTKIAIAIDKKRFDIYSRCIEIIGEYVDLFVQSELCDIERFAPLVGIVECIHMISLCFYHSYRANGSLKITQAYLAIFSLLARRAVEAIKTRQGVSIPTKRLELED